MRGSLALLALAALVLAAHAAGLSLWRLLLVLSAVGFLSGAIFGFFASTGDVSGRVWWALRAGVALALLVPLAAAASVPLAVAGLVMAAAGALLSALEGEST